MSNSPLVSYTRISPNKTSPRNHKIDTITIHCVVGQLTVERIGDCFISPSSKASSNYGVGKDGKIGMYVEEKDRSWCSSSASNDNRAITIEVASDTKHPYAINDKAYSALIDLCVDICQRNDIRELKWKGDKSLIGQVDKQNMTVHRWFANKACPGDYLYNLHGQIAAEVNARLCTQTMFPDINGHYAEHHICKLCSYGILSGYEDGTFKPDNTVTRAEFATMVANALEKGCGEIISEASIFTDIAGHWAESAIKKILTCGIVNGFIDKTFKPEQLITRGQAAVMACNFLLYCGVEMMDSNGFPDINGHYAEKHIKTLNAFGVVNGYEDGLFRPDEEITRGQAAMYIANCLTVLGK